MGRYIGGLLLLCALLVLPSRMLAQHPLDEGQQKQLGISNAQQKQMEEIFAKAGPKRHALQTRLHDLYTELHDLDANYEFDQRRATVLIDQIVDLHRQLLALHAANEARMRKILSVDQFQRLRDMIKKERELHQHDGSHPDWKGWGGDHDHPRPPGDHPDPPSAQNISQHKN